MKTATKHLFLLAVIFLVGLQNSKGQSITLAPPTSSTTYVDQLSVSYSITGDPSAQQVQIVFTHTSGKNFAADTIKTWTLTLKTASLSQTFTLKPTDLTNAANLFTASPTVGMPEGFYSVYAQYIRPASAGSLQVRTTTRTNVYLDLYTQTPYLVSPATNGAASSSIYIYDSIPEFYLSGSAALIFANGSYKDTLKLADNILKDSLYINPASVSNPTYIQSATSSTIPDGTYSVTFQYQDRYSHPVASVVNTNFLIQNSTPAPTLRTTNDTTVLSNRKWNSFSNWGYTLPCQPKSNTALLTVNPGGYNFTLPNTYGSPVNLSSTLHGIPSGTYSVTLTYQDFLSNPAKGDTARNVMLDFETLPATISLPTSGAAFNDTMSVKFNIPESFTSGSVKLIFDSAGITSSASDTLVLKNVVVGNDSLLLHVENLFDTSIVTSVTKTGLSDGTYTLRVSYQDSIGNAAAVSSVRNISIDTHTLAPTIAMPLTSTRYNQLIPIIYMLPEAAYAGSVKLIFDSAGTGVTDTITMIDASPRSTIYFNAHQFSATSAFVSATKDSIGDGVYNITVLYSDALNNPAASTTISNVTIDSHTAAPVITLPAASSSIKGPLTVQFTLPETPYLNTALLIFNNTGTSDTLIINTLSQGANTVVLDPTNLYASTFVYSAGQSVLNDGVYNITIQYTDDLLNPAAFTIDSNVTVDNHTQTPSITYPTSNFSASDSLDVQFTLPEAFSDSSVTLIFFDGSTTNIVALQNISKGTNSIKLAVENLQASPYVRSATGNVLPDGVYSMTLSYQDSLRNGAASTSVSGIKFDTQTLTPSIISPSGYTSSSSPLAISFTLPEAPFNNSAVLVFDSAGTKDTVVLSNVFIGSNTVEINTHDITSSVNVTSATRNALSDGIYTITLAYQDAMENPAATAFASNITIDTYTKVPTLTLPAASAHVGHSLSVKFTIPESYRPGSVTLSFDSAGTSVNMLVLKNITAGVDSFTIDPSNLYFSSSYVSSVTKNSLSDGIYKITLSYQDTLGNPAATVFANNINIDLHTEAAMLTAPLNDAMVRHSATIPMAFTLPENPLSGSIVATLSSASYSCQLVLSDGPAGNFNLNINPDSVFLSPGVFSMTPNGVIPDGSYTVSISYQDALRNSAVASNFGTFIVDRVTLSPTLYFPGSNSTNSGTVNVGFTIPEEAKNNTVSLQLLGADTVNISLQTSGTGFQFYTVNANNLSTTIGSTGASSLTIPDGIYTLKVSYQDTLGNPFSYATEVQVAVTNVLAPPVIATQAMNVTCANNADLSTAITTDTTGLTLAFYSDAQLTTSTNRVVGPGTYYVKATNINGVATSASIVVNAQYRKPPAPYTNGAAICSGSTATLSASGLGTPVWYTAPTGGTWLASGNSFTTPPLTDSTTYYVADSTCVSSATRNPVTALINPLPTVTAHATATTVCAGTSITLTGSGASSYTWTNSVTDGVSFAANASHTYSVTGTDSNHCSSTFSITVNVNSLPTVTANTTATAVCAGASVTLTGDGANSYAWTGGVNDGVSFTPTASHTYTVTGRDGNNCSNTSSVTVQVNALPLVEASASSTAVCNGASTSVIGNGASTYIWTGGVQDRTLFTPTATETYTVTGTDTNNCSNTAWVTITFNELPTVTAHATATTVCEGTSVTLTGEGATNYTWNNGVTDGVSFEAHASHTYSVTGSNGNCSSTDTITVNVNALPTVTANATATTVCAGTSVTLSGAGASSYVWTNGVNDGVSFTPNASHAYSVTGTDGNNCSATATVAVSVNPMPVATTNVYSNTVISADQDNASYQWLNCNNNNAPINNADRQFFAVTVSGDYSVIVSLNGCVDTSSCVNIIVTGIEEAMLNNSLKIYPNPSNGIFTIHSTTSEIYTIMDELGNVIRTIKLDNDNNYTAADQTLSNGIYFIVGYNHDSVTRQKLVVVK